MRTVICAIALLCQVAPVESSPGWCPRPSPPTVQVTRSLEVSADLKTVRPLRKGGFESETIAYSRHDQPRGIGGWVNATITGDKLQLVTGRRTCHETGAGCFSGYWETPAKLVLEDPVPRGSCIAYSFAFTTGMVIGLGKEMRIYDRRSDGQIVKGKSIAAPDLVPIDMVDGRPILQEPSGRLWIGGIDKPSLTPSVTLAGRVLAMSEPTGGVSYAFTTDALYMLDATLAVKQRIDGEVWSVLHQDVPARRFVLSIDRAHPKPRVVLREFELDGTLVRSGLVYEGAVTSARLGRSGQTFVVHLS